IVAAVGTYLLVGSHAATPYASLTAGSGSLSGNATKQTCSGASDGNCVVFGSAASKGATYYVSPNGSDSNSGTSASSPWKTVTKVDNSCPQPGDTVLFQGGQTFSDTDLRPPCSGTSGNPITYASYGSGRAILTDVWLPTSNHDLVFDNLELTSNNQLFSACGACNLAHYNITLKNSFLHNTSNLGIDVLPLDHNWLIEGNTIQHTGDSGILVAYASNITTTHNTISYTGEDYTSIGYGTHGIYAKGPNETISYNDFSHDQGGQAISVRAHGDYIYGNTVHDTPQAFAFFDYDEAPPPQGTSYVYDNKIWNLNEDSIGDAVFAFYYDNQADPQGKSPSVNFVIASNTFVMSNSTEAFNLSPTPSAASVTTVNNIFSGTYGSAYRGCATCTEYNNNWYGASSNIPSGSHDQFINPNLSAAPAFTLPAGSPLINAGTTNVPGLTYTHGTNGQPLQYAGSAPDIGAVDSQ
ncbi:MAG TPA: right-handed parallel beta-helix repeat-containing protein, partial [Candidatus Dormibacteraeota bacterium]|nr:right-handed parallel beta-helix repeat-containing protein [Candidatus Dormibacteraeota bacterium]